MTQRAVPAGDVDYESTGIGYEQQRRSDPRIAQAILSALGDASTVVNVGAGAGSYEPTDRYVLAVEPSAAMRARRRAVGAMPAIDASAQSRPLDDNAVDAALAVLTIHQWGDALVGGLQEMRRVASGPVVILTLDGTTLDDFWLNEYLPARAQIERQRFPDIQSIRRELGGTSTINPVPIPLDCSDGFVEAFYGRPESLLDPAVRAAQSAWQFLDQTEIDRGLTQLTDDLRSGSWDSRHGRLRETTTYTGPLALIITAPEAER